MEKSNKPLIIGSLAFDIIFSITNDFRDAIPLKDGKIENYNASYVSHAQHKRFGGNGGNVGYWLSKCGTAFHLLSSFGEDLHTSGYHNRLVEQGGTIKGPESDYTATAYMISDPLGQQCIIWQPNAWEALDRVHITDFYDDQTIQDTPVALISVVLPEIALRLAQELKALNPNITIILDTGQVTTLYTPEILNQCVDTIDILTSNEVEYLHFTKAFATLQKPNPWDAGRVSLIETLGKDGCRLVQDRKEIRFEAHPCDKAIEPTGAGDAFRAGVVAELCQGKSLKESIPLGLNLGAQCVTIIGPQSD